MKIKIEMDQRMEFYLSKNWFVDPPQYNDGTFDVSQEFLDEYESVIKAYFDMQSKLETLFREQGLRSI